MRVIDLFSGIGGFSLGLEAAGFQTTQFCEIDPYCQKVLKKHWPEVPCHDDIKTYAPILGSAELVCGGYPCQPFSTAGKRQGEADERHLWPEMLRIIRSVRPRWVVAENVAGHIELGFDEVAASLAAEGFTIWTFIIPACAVDAQHRRDRIWIVANSARKDDGKSDSQKMRGQKQKFGNGGSTGNVAHAARIQQGRQEQRPKRKRIGARRESSLGWLTESWCQRGEWESEPDVGRSFDGLSRWMDGLDMAISHKSLLAYAKTASQRPEEVLSALRSGVAPAEIRKSFGGSGIISPQEILLAYLCKLEERHIDEARLQLEGAEASEKSMRGMRSHEKPASAPHQSKHQEQQAYKYPNSLSALSQFLACFAEKAWVDYCRENAIPRGWEEGISRVANSIPARVDRLRGLGNAIVPQIAQIIGQAIMRHECAD